jgi:Predicted nucleotide-binding protein containing TIR-like domain/TIR domain
MTEPAVFISSSAEGLAIARELGRQLEKTAAVMLWPEGAFNPGKTIAESLSEVADRSDFAIVILTADDMRRGSPRSNVIFELGFLAGRLGLSRTFVVVGDPERIALPTDLAGALYIPLSKSNFPDVRAAIAPAAAVIRKAMADISVRQDRRPVEYHTCFISYSWHDQDFAARLHDDLQDAGIRSWLEPKEKGQFGMERSSQAQDKMLLIISQASVESSWLKREVNTALELERERKKTVLFPISLDDAAFKRSSGVLEVIQKKGIGDFRHWQDKRLYQRAFSRLVRDLAISASVESEKHA